MMRSRGVYLFRAMICFTLAPIMLIGTLSYQEILNLPPLLAFFAGVGIAILFFLVGLLNYYVYKKDRDREEGQQARIKELEEENRNLRNKD